MTWNLILHLKRNGKPVLVQSDRIGSPPNLKTVRDGDSLHL